MHFAGATRDAVADGRIDLTFRLWSRPQAKVGGRYRVGAVTIEVDEMELVPFGTVTSTEAKRSGYADCEALRAITACDKLNIAALGNAVSQLHVHVIARFRSDVAWPRPVWGVMPPLAHDATEVQNFISALRRKIWLG